MEDYGFMCVHKLSPFVTNFTFRKKCSRYLIAKEVKNSNASGIPYNIQLRDHGENKIEISAYICLFHIGFFFQDRHSFCESFLNM